MQHLYRVKVTVDGQTFYVLPEYVGDRATWDGYKHHCPGCNCPERNV